MKIRSINPPGALISLFSCMIIIVLMTNTIPAQDSTDIRVENDSTIPPPDKFQSVQIKFFTIDHALLNYNEGYVQLEVFALVDRGFLATDSVEGGVQAQYQITFKVFCNDSLLTGDTWTRTDFSPDPTQRLGGQKIPELMKYVIQPGDYRVEVIVSDLVAKVYRSEDIRVHAEPFPENEVAISDIIIASRVEKAHGDAGEFDHNGLLVLPYADRIFGLNANTMYFYCEIYNLSVSEGGLYTMIREIRNDHGEKVLELDPVTRPSAAPDLVDHGGFSVANLTTGAYTLNIKVIDEITGESDSDDQTFWVFKPGDTEVQPMLGDPGFDIAAMSEEQIEFELKFIRYLMNRKVINAVKELDLAGKRAFLARFWIANDPNPGTRENEFREEYISRVHEANARFGTLNREGWTTDLGRIYCLNGEPNDIENHTFEINAVKAYQIWSYYSVEGGVYYVFVDRNNYGDYVLVHSTKDGEIFNPNWRSIELQGF